MPLGLPWRRDPTLTHQFLYSGNCPALAREVRSPMPPRTRLLRPAYPGSQQPRGTRHQEAREERGRTLPAQPESLWARGTQHRLELLTLDLDPLPGAEKKELQAKTLSKTLSIHRSDFWLGICEVHSTVTGFEAFEPLSLHSASRLWKTAS